MTTDKKLDVLVSKFIRSCGKCEVCGRTENLNCHHFIGRRVKILRWSMENLVCACSYCHKLSKSSFHEDPAWGVEWMKLNRPDDYNYCVQHRNDAPMKEWQKKELLDKYKMLEYEN